MPKIRFRRDKISIKNIGKQRFWIGITAGFATAIGTSLFFNYSREILRFITGIYADLLILDKDELQFFNFFFSILSAVLGLSITIWIWMGNNTNKRKKDKIYKQLSRTNALFVFWLMFMVIARLGSIFSIVLYAMPGYEKQLDLYENFWFLFVIIPLFVFAQNWFIVRLVYRSGKWILLSSVTCVLLAFTLHFTTTVSQGEVNNLYHKMFIKKYKYIDEEIKKAKDYYGIEFDSKTIKYLKERYTNSSIEQVISIKASFVNNKKVSMDTIILQKIIIRNFKRATRLYSKRNYIENWGYALPNDVLAQLGLFDVDSNETKELFEILKEQIDLINTPIIDWKDYKNYTRTEIRRSIYAEYNVPIRLIFQLKTVRDSLLKDEKYHDYIKRLPEIII